MFMVQVAQLGSTAASPKIHLETAPTRDASQFQDLAAIDLTTAVGAVTRTRIGLFGNPTICVMRWLRWRLSNADATLLDVTFRIAVMVYAR